MNDCKECTPDQPCKKHWQRKLGESESDYDNRRLLYELTGIQDESMHIQPFADMIDKLTYVQKADFAKRALELERDCAIYKAMLVEINKERDAWISEYRASRVKLEATIASYEIDRINLVAMTLDRDELDEQYKLAVARFKDADKRCAEMGTKNAECWDKINQLERDLKEYTTLYREYKDRYDYAVIDGTYLRGKLEQQEDRFDQLDGEYQDLVRICTALYRTDKEAIRQMINESLGGDNHEKFKNHLGV